MLIDWPERLEPGAELWPEGDAEPLRIARMEVGGRIPVLHLEGIGSREAAEPLVGRYLEAPAHELAEGAYYWGDLVGLRVESADGALVGELVEIFRAGGNEVYRVVGADGEQLVPALRSVVLKIDLAAGVMVIAANDAEEVR